MGNRGSIRTQYVFLRARLVEGDGQGRLPCQPGKYLHHPRSYSLPASVSTACRLGLATRRGELTFFVRRRQYRDELLELSGELGTPSRTAAERVSWDADEASDRREAVAVDLLNVLHK